MKYASFRYDSSLNVGDEIQTLATEQHLPRVDTKVDRDSLALFKADEPHVVICQGWFSHTPDRCFPPSPAIVPVFVGFHVESDDHQSAAHFLSPEGVAYLKRYEPIGCRDEGTRVMLERAGVRAFTSRCLTLTFDRREIEPTAGKVFVVDGDLVPVPARLRHGAVAVEQDMPSLRGNDAGKSAAAKRLLEMYRDEARLVITTRLHCALPCVALGVPVVFFGNPDDYRLGILSDVGVPIHRLHPRSRVLRRLCRRRGVRAAWSRWAHRSVDWSPAPLDVENYKAELRETVQLALRAAENTARQLEADAPAIGT